MEHRHGRLLLTTLTSGLALVMCCLLSLSPQIARGQETSISLPGKANCNCFLTDDCKLPSELCVSGGCEGSNDPFNPKTGMCKDFEPVPPELFPNVVLGLNAILVAYETAGNRGGPVDPGVKAELEKLGLTETQRVSLHNVALSLMNIYLGISDPQIAFRKGHITAPKSSDQCYGFCPGSVAAFQPYLRKEASRIRSAIVADLKDPKSREVQRTFRRISDQTPEFIAFGPCDSPLSRSTGRYKNRGECVATEVGNILARIRSASSGRK